MFRPGIPLPSTGRSAESAAPDAGASQPRPEEDAQQPTAAERVRTLVESNGTASLTIPGIEEPDEPGAGSPAARTVMPDGDVLLLVPGDSLTARAAVNARDDELTAVMEITDVAPVSVPHRIRGHAWVAGWLTPVPDAERAACAMLLAERQPVGGLLDASGGPGIGGPGIGGPGIGGPGDESVLGGRGRPPWILLRLEVGEAWVDDLWGASSVEPDEFVAAACDPLVAHEAELLQHLHSAHAEQVNSLCALLGERAGGSCGVREQAVPVALDRFGLRIRFTDGDQRSFDARFDFPEPVRDVAELRRAMHSLFEAAIE
ncbi:DUF2470 domain-containing protein [Streptomyces sp. H27-D2]|uniref:DUF2470 domain-containing protein n=1 Tax=Streptomyces sp. H27-D2 TaxID=3046304 RepID=UPI002DB8BDCD|nr:DUF2470 domain-containing protein [Streptomyces sp. H27-D2]MEC4015567.1 DUF2470 domain-containing protein [Streptomyces sp. H27-D2]